MVGIEDIAVTFRDTGGLSTAVRASYEREALTFDEVIAYFIVTFSPRVAVRTKDRLDAPAVGMRVTGDVVAVSEIRGKWVRLAVDSDTQLPRVCKDGSESAQSWILTDTAGTSLAHLGRLLAPIPPPKASVVASPYSLYVSPPAYMPHECDSTRVACGTAGGCDGGNDGAWRVILGGTDSRWSKVARAVKSAPSAGDAEIAPTIYDTDDAAALSALSLLLILMAGAIGSDAGKGTAVGIGAAAGEGADEQGAESGSLLLAKMVCELCRDARALLLRQSDVALALEDAPAPCATASRRVVSGEGTQAVDALMLAAKLSASSQHAATGAWLRLPSAPATTAGRNGTNDLAMDAVVGTDHGALLCFGDDVALVKKWRIARSAAADAQVQVMVSGGAHARQVAQWLLDGGVSDVCVCSRANSRAAKRGARHDEWTRKWSGAGVDRPTLWAAVKWGLGLVRTTRAGRPCCGGLHELADVPLISIGQLEPRPGCSQGDWIQGGIEALNAAAATAASQGASLLTAPEIFLQGYEVCFYARDKAAVTRAEAVGRVGAIASRHGIGILVGYLELESTVGAEQAARDRPTTRPSVYNSAVLVDPKGELVAHRRKSVLTDDEIAAGLAAGPSPTLTVNAAIDVSDATSYTGDDAPEQVNCTPPLPWLGGRRIGLLICAEIEVPEVADAAVAAGADTLLVIACAWVPYMRSNVIAFRKGTSTSEWLSKGGSTPEPPTWLACAAHATHHGVFVAYCNQAQGVGTTRPNTGDGAAGTIQGGGSRLIAPDGRDVAIVAEWERTAVRVASLGATKHHRLSWSGRELFETLALCWNLSCN